jgi:hypothetical protein
MVYTLVGEEMFAFTPELTEQSRIALDLDAAKLAISGNSAYFLCDETVEYRQLTG